MAICVGLLPVGRIRRIVLLRGVTGPSGDTFLVYPGPCSSIRFELLKQGIQDFDAYTLAQKKAPDDARLREAVRRANLEHDGRKVSVEEVDAARRLVNAVLAETR